MRQDKVEIILNTANKMFARYGLRKTSVDEIARLARVAKGTIYNHFATKEAIYVEVLRREVDEVFKKMVKNVAKETRPEAKFARYFRSRFSYMRQAMNVLNINREGLEAILPIAEHVRNEIHEREVRILDAILHEGIKKGVFRVTNVPLAAQTIAQALRAIEFGWLFQENDEQINLYITELLNLFYSGLLTPKAQL